MLNIKNVLLLCIMSHPLTYTSIQIDDIKKDLLNCKKNWFASSCKEQEKTYNRMKDLFLASFEKDIQEGIITNKTHFYQEKHNSSILAQIPFIGNYFKKKLSKENELKILIAWGLSLVKEKFSQFLTSPLTAEEFCNTKLSEVMTNVPLYESSYIEDKIGNYVITHASIEQIDRAKQIIKIQIKERLINTARSRGSN